MPKSSLPPQGSCGERMALEEQRGLTRPGQAVPGNPPAFPEHSQHQQAGSLFPTCFCWGRSLSQENPTDI